jgi:hypothetical protein
LILEYPAGASGCVRPGRFFDQVMTIQILAAKMP